MLVRGEKTLVEDVVLRDFALKDHALNLYVSPERLFVPNTVSRLFSKVVEIGEGDTVFDIGTGTGVLAIWAALHPCRCVWAVDPVWEHCELAARNARRYAVDGKLRALRGSLFDPLPDGLEADVIIGDVSGIADAPGRALGWYSSEVPAGGGDGTEVIVELLRQTHRRLRFGGKLYFPVAVGLSDDEKITAAAEACFESLVRKVDVWFPLSEDEYDVVKCCLPPSLLAKLRQRGSRMAWNGHIYEATRPRS